VVTFVVTLPGFIWSPPLNTPKWDEMFEDIKKFNLENGNFAVKDEAMRWWISSRYKE
jgi:hypothetical protein